MFSIINLPSPLSPDRYVSSNGEFDYGTGCREEKTGCGAVAFIRSGAHQATHREVEDTSTMDVVAEGAKQKEEAGKETGLAK